MNSRKEDDHGEPVQREYKDRLFNLLFGSEENKAWTLSLYNAINQSHYDDASQIQIISIREVMYLSMHNDVSFMVSGEINLYEQQSTFNPNMPLRLLQYAGNLYERYVTEHKLNKYGARRLVLPAPRLVVFYNGTLDKEDETLLRLSDSYPPGKNGDIEVTVRMININYGRSEATLKACEPLREYAWLVEEIRKNMKIMEIEKAVDQAIAMIPPDYVIKAFLEEHRAEVKGMLLTEYNEAVTMEMFKEEGRAEGREEGRLEGRVEGYMEALAALARDGVITVSEGASRAGVTEAELRKYMTK